ncbi:MAG: site-2 protease family protein [Ktedonobacterales bacterium]
MNILVIVESFIAFVLAVTLHGAAQAVAAAALGDPSPAKDGRLTLAPRRQMAVVGTIVAIVYSFAWPASAGLGWGRPLTVDARRLRVGPNLGLILVALAGPVVNLLLGVVIALGLGFLPGYLALDGATLRCAPGQLNGAALQQCFSAAQPAYLLRIDQFLFTFAVTNIVLALLNLIPLAPLDGYKILFALLPSPQAISFRRAEPYMELTLLIIFFVLPYLLGFLGIPFSPGDLLISLARSVAGTFAPAINMFYQFL